MLIAIILLITFLPALLVFGFVKLFKNQLARNPNKKMLLRYVLMYVFLVVCVGAILYGLSGLA